MAPLFIFSVPKHRASAPATLHNFPIVLWYPLWLLGFLVVKVNSYYANYQNDSHVGADYGGKRYHQADYGKQPTKRQYQHQNYNDKDLNPIAPSSSVKSDPRAKNDPWQASWVDCNTNEKEWSSGNSGASSMDFHWPKIADGEQVISSTDSPWPPTKLSTVDE